MKAWRYRFKLAREGEIKESVFAIGEYAAVPNGETSEAAQARRAGGRLTLAEARDERVKARALVKQGINPVHNRQLERVKREQDSANTFEAVAREWVTLKTWERRLSSEVNSVTAEQRFRQAFERLKVDKPKVIAGTPVSQNNVAKEAGCDPSALRKTRFPSLVREIQAYVEINEQKRTSKRKVQIKRREARSEAADRLKQVSAQRDFAQSQLVSAQRRIVELMSELRVLRTQLDSVRPSAAVLSR